MPPELTLTALTASPTTLVDHGRPGLRHRGYPAGGPADRDSALLAREMLASPPEQPLLEFAQHPGRWELSGHGTFVLTGADFRWTLNGRKLRRYRAHQLTGETAVLTGKMPATGLRGYLNVAGAWRTSPTPDEHQLLLHHGSVEALRPDAYLPAGWTHTIRTDTRPATKFPVPEFPEATTHVLPTLPGPEWDWLSPREQAAFLAATWRIDPQSNRQGLMLHGEDFTPPTLPELLSSPVLPGTIQLTPTGPILLGPDAQTIGGYPRVRVLAETTQRDLAYQIPLRGRIRFR